MSLGTWHTSVEKADACLVEQVTDWFHRDIKPAHVGIYEICYDIVSFPVGRGYWNGVIWLNPDTMRPSGIQNWQWRGLVFKH